MPTDMKSTCLLILFIVGCIQSSSALDLGSFFRSYSAPKAASSEALLSLSKLPTQEFLATEEQHTEEDASAAYSSELYSEYRSDSDSFVYNSSSEQEIAESSNSSSGVENGTDSHYSSSSAAIEVVSNSTVAGSSSKSDVESTTAAHESQQPNEVVWNKVSTPAQPSTTVGQITAVNSTTEKEEVVLVTGETTTGFGPRSIYQKSIEWLEDEYTLSILLPISAGIVFAITIICTIAVCRCVRRCCRRRRFRKKCLPDSVKSLSASDRARLLGDTSDEEF